LKNADLKAEGKRDKHSGNKIAVCTPPLFYRLRPDGGRTLRPSVLRFLSPYSDGGPGFRKSDSPSFSFGTIARGDSVTIALLSVRFDDH
jgi:hypothetical protein